MTYRCCPKCKEAKSLESFGKDKHKEDGLAVRCKECRRQDVNLYYKQNREKCLTATKRWTKNNAEKYKETYTKYYHNNKPSFFARSAQRRASKLKATPQWADKDRIEIKYWYAQWLSETVGIPYEVDHIIPLQNKTICGLHTEDNLQVIPMTENRRKSNSFRGEGL